MFCTVGLNFETGQTERSFFHKYFLSLILYAVKICECVVYQVAHTAYGLSHSLWKNPIPPQVCSHLKMYSCTFNLNFTRKVKRPWRHKFPLWCKEKSQILTYYLAFHTRHQRSCLLSLGGYASYWGYVCNF